MQEGNPLPVFNMIKLLFFAVALLAVHAPAATTNWKGSSEIEFAGTSTLHSWAGKVKAEPFTATVITSDKGQLETLQATVQVKVSGMDTAEEGRDKNLRKAMKIESHPLISATMNAPFSAILDTKTGEPTKLPFKLTLLGKEHAVSGKIGQWKSDDKTASFELDFELSLKDCGITVPTVLLFIKVGDTIKLHAKVKLQRPIN